VAVCCSVSEVTCLIHIFVKSHLYLSHVYLYISMNNKHVSHLYLSHLNSSHLYLSHLYVYINDKHLSQFYFCHRSLPSPSVSQRRQERFLFCDFFFVSYLCVLSPCISPRRCNFFFNFWFLFFLLFVMNLCNALMYLWGDRKMFFWKRSEIFF